MFIIGKKEGEEGERGGKGGEANRGKGKGGEWDERGRERERIVWAHGGETGNILHDNIH